MLLWIWALAVAGGRSPQTASISRPMATTRLACNNKAASTLRSRGPPARRGAFSCHTSTGPRIAYFIDCFPLAAESRTAAGGGYGMDIECVEYGHTVGWPARLVGHTGATRRGQ